MYAHTMSMNELCSHYYYNLVLMEPNTPSWDLLDLSSLPTIHGLWGRELETEVLEAPLLTDLQFDL